MLTIYVINDAWKQRELLLFYLQVSVAFWYFA